jgi:hypothetical protein
MSDDSTPNFLFPAICRKKVTAAFDGGRLTSDGGVLLLAQAERGLGLATALARCIADRRDQSRVIHDVDDILRARMLAIACGYEDADDLDALRAFARGCAVVTFDHEHVPLQVLRALEDEGVSVQPPARALEFAQNKLLMRKRLATLDLPMPVWAEIKTSQQLQEFFANELVNLNQQLDPHERLSCLVLDPTPWTVASGFITPTLKVKRNQIEDAYGSFWEAWTAQSKPIVWMNNAS